MFAAPVGERAQAIRQLFVEALDFNPDSGQIPLISTSAGISLPHAADRIAALDGVHVCYVALDTRDSDRVRKPEATAAARQLAEQLATTCCLSSQMPPGASCTSFIPCSSVLSHTSPHGH